MSTKMMSMVLTLLFTCLAFFGLPRTEHAIQHSCTAQASFPERCLIITRVSIALDPRYAHYLMDTRCRIHREIGSSQIHGSK
jgi:hypothetical protein